LQKIFTDDSQTVIFPELRKEERLSYCPHGTYVCRLCPMSSRTELSAVVFGQYVQPILNLAFFSFWSYLKDRIYRSNPRKEELKENVRNKTAIFLQNSFKR
jgi:hypothetical protein